MRVQLVFYLCFTDYFGPPLSNLQEISDQDDSDDHDDDGSEQSQLEVIRQLLPISDINTSNTGPFSSTINQHYKRPYPSEENGGPENRPLKKARFLTPNTLTVHRASPSRPTGSVSAPPPQAQIQDRTNSHRAPFPASSNLLPAGLHMEKLMGAVKPPETPGRINSSMKTNTDLVAGILPQRIRSQVGMDEANKTADTADQSGSTLVDSSSDLSLSLFAFHSWTSTVMTDLCRAAAHRRKQFQCPSLIRPRFLIQTTHIQDSGLKLSYLPTLPPLRLIFQK